MDADLSSAQHRMPAAGAGIGVGQGGGGSGVVRDARSD